MWRHSERHRQWLLGGRGVTAIVRADGPRTVRDEHDAELRGGPAGDVESSKATAEAVRAELTAITTVEREG